MMSTINYLSHPIISQLLKMLLIVAMLFWINKMAFNARTKALMWQIGLVFLLILPCSHLLLPALQLPILPLIEATDTLLSNPTETTDFLTAYSSGFYFIDAVFMLLILVGLLLLMTLVVQLSQLHKITQQAHLLKGAIAQSIINNCLKAFKFSRQPKVLVSKQINAPCTWGFINPVILLPTNISHDHTLKLVLLHEMAHVSRNDWLWLMISKIMVAIFWFNPLVWIVQRQMINSSESACDELVLQHPIQPSDYAETLLGFHQTYKGLSSLTTNMAAQSLLYQRLHQILNPRRISMKKRHPSWLIASLSFAFVLLSMAQLTTAQTAAHPVPDSEEVADSAPVIAPSPEAPPAVPMPESEPKAAYPTAPPAPTTPPKPVLPAAPVKQASPQQIEVVNSDDPISKLALAELTAEKRMAREAEMTRFRSERTQHKAEQQRVKAEERALKAEQLKVEREVSMLKVQRQRLETQNEEREQLRAEEIKVRREAEKLAQQARLVRLKEAGHFPNTEK